jgi:hypothetical protein
VSADLGTWSRPQATVLVKVLKRAGVRATTQDTADGAAVSVTVAEDQADRAHAAIAAEMDTIARAAREERATRERRASVTRIDDARRRRGRSRGSGDGPPLVTERLRRLGPLIGIIVAAMMVVAVVPGNLRFPVMIVVVLGLVYLLGRGDGDGTGGGHGPGRRRPGA